MKEHSELESLESLCATWETELEILTIETQPHNLPGRAMLKRWTKLCEMRSDLLKVISQLRSQSVLTV